LKGVQIVSDKNVEAVPRDPVVHSEEGLSRYRISKHKPKELPYSTSSICPTCLLDNEDIRVIEARIYREDNQIMISKECPEHGRFVDVYWSDADMFERVMKYWYRTVGLDNPRTKSKEGCPKDCGQCPEHLAHTALGLIDVTNRCNLRCPICFANAAATNRIYEPTDEQIKEMLANLRSNLPIPSPAVQFAGGEPTVSDKLPKYVRWANEMGFDHIIVATNGIRMANNPEYVTELREAGMNTIYLQFDGVSEKPYLEARGRDLRDIKNAALDSCRQAHLDGVVLVPTIVKGLNDGELGDIVRFGIENRDIVRCINIQPVSITGRVDHAERNRMRITTPEVIINIEKQTEGKISRDDWYPVSSMMGVGRALGLLKGVPTVELHAHFACGMATFLFLDDDGSYIPITQVVDLEMLLTTLDDVCDLYAERKILRGLRAKLKLLGFTRHIKKKSYMKPIITSFLKRGSYSSLAAFMHRVIMLGVMHFQDPYNLDIERVQHCTINYATPDGRIIPFCTYNNLHRNGVEAKFSTKTE
jgi:hypothetical protein